MAENTRRGLNLTPPPKRQFQEGGLAVESSTIPRQRPSQQEIEDRQTQRALAEEFGNIEFEADLYSKGFLDPLSRLGLDANVARIVPSKWNAAGLYILDSSSPEVGRMQESRESLGYSEPLSEGNVLTIGDFSGSNTVWTHEFRHRGIEKLLENFDNDPNRFIEQYLSDADEDTKLVADRVLSGESEELLVDYMDRRSPQELGFNTEILSDDYASIRPRFREPLARVEEAIMQAARDRLTEEGVPPPAQMREREQEEKGWLPGFLKNIFNRTPTFQEGGLAESTPQRPTPRPRLDLTKEDILAIERMVWAEGRGESPEGRDAIRSVILNRIASDRFDGNIKDVLERSDTRVDDRGREVTTYQFQPIGVYGSVDNIPAPETDLDQQYFEFLDFIERGEDASGSRSFFQNTEKAEDRYVGVDPMVIDNHTFYKGLEGQEPVTDINFSHNVRLVGDDVGMAEGGMAMDKEMSSILKEEGGLTDDGMDRDPVSGNEVPPGSMANEVRDDIDVRLSDGEYVVPADVVRYYGVKFFEDLRGEAKMGLNQMERTGRIGGEPISPEQMARVDEMGMAQGGLVPASDFQQKIPSSAPQLMGQQFGMATGGFMGNTSSYLRDDGSIDFDKLVGQSSQNMYLQTPYASLADLFADFSQVGSYTQRMREGRPAPTAPTTPSFQNIEYRTYIGPDGQIMMIPFLNGEPQIDIPVGFNPQGDTTAETPIIPSVGSDGGDGPVGTGVTAVRGTSSTQRQSNLERALEGVDFTDPLGAGTKALEGSSAIGGIAGGVLGALAAGPLGARLGSRLGVATQTGGQIADAAVNAEVARILGYNTSVLDEAINNSLEGLTGVTKSFVENAVNSSKEAARNALFDIDSPFDLTRDKFQSDEAFTSAMESVAPEGMTYSEDTGGYTRDPGTSAAPTTSTRPTQRPDRDSSTGGGTSSSSDTSNVGNWGGDRDGDGIPNAFDFDDGVGVFDKSRGAAKGGLMRKSTPKKRTRKTK